MIENMIHSNPEKRTMVREAPRTVLVLLGTLGGYILRFPQNSMNFIQMCLSNRYLDNVPGR